VLPLWAFVVRSKANLISCLMKATEKIYALLRQPRRFVFEICFSFFYRIVLFFYHGATAPSRAGPPHCLGFTITIRHTTVGRNPLDEWSARRRDLYLTTHNIQNRQTSIPPLGFEPTIPESERLQTYALDRAATGIGKPVFRNCNNKECEFVV
jgi:hypothetical protein